MISALEPLAIVLRRRVADCGARNVTPLPGTPPMTTDQFNRIFTRIYMDPGLNHDLRDITLRNFHTLVQIIAEELTRSAPLQPE